MQEETEAEANTTSMEEDYSILDQSEGDQDEMLTTAKETAKKSSESVSALVNNFLKVQVGSNNVFENGGPNTSTSTSKFPSVRAPEPQKQEGGGLPKEYSMVRVARRNWLAATSLSGIGPLGRKPVSQSSGFSTGSLVVMADGRHLNTQNFHSLKDKLNVSISFEPRRMVCVTCTDKHTILGASLQPVCVVLSDHNFSLYVTASRSESCMLVISAEDGLLADLENIFRDVFQNYTKPLGSLPQGSVVLLGSTSHLSLLGLSAYTEDCVRCSGNLINLSGPAVTVCLLVQVQLSGVSSTKSIRDMANLDSWILSAKLPRNIVLSESRDKLWVTICSSASTFLGQSPPSSVLYLPISLNTCQGFSSGN